MDLRPVAAAAPPNPNVSAQVAQAAHNGRDIIKHAKLEEAQSSAAPHFVYFSPVIKIDKSTNTAIFQYRDRDSGEVTREFPSKSEIDAYTTDAVKRVEKDTPEAERYTEDA
jgi:hypothetical protein